MTKKLFLFTFLLATIFGKQITPNEAEKIAIDWFSGNTLSKSVTKTVNNIETYQYNGKDALYIVNLSPASFVIVSGDDESGNVLAFSNENNFQTKSLHPELEKLLKIYSEAVINKKSLQSLLPAENFTAVPDTIDPLVATKWNQNWPYNKFCPIDSAATSSDINYRPYAGCVATAMAQVMKYYNYPDSGFGSHSYNHANYGRQTAHFDSTEYDWKNMLNVISEYSQTENIDAVAQLIYHCGVAVNMGYGIDGSGSYSQLVPEAVKTYYNYSSEIEILNRLSYSYDKWVKIIKAELNDNRPIYYSGDNGEAGHAFVCDGYEYRKKTGHFFHFNWGWSGSSDGYFSITAMVLDLNFGHNIITNFAPAGQIPKFQANVRKVIVPPGEIQFTDLSDGTPTGWEWDFDFDGIVDSYEQNPTWIYEEANDYTVSLTVRYDSLSYQKTYVEYIDAQSQNEIYGTISEDRTIESDIIKVLGNTLISSDATLTITPGATIQFEGNYELKIDGNIRAIGTKDDSITFTVSDPKLSGWKGINLTGNANDTTDFAYCSFNYVEENTVIKSINNHNLKISNCRFSNNNGNVIGVWFHNKNRLIIDKCLFENNTNPQEGFFKSWGTIFTGFLAEGAITNSIIRNNEMSEKGAILISNTSDISMINNTIIENNHEESTPAVIQVSTSSNLDLVNTILWNDGFDEVAFDGDNTTSIRNCNVQNGLQEINGDRPEFLHYSGNINVDPKFEDNSLILSPLSQCIDHGLTIFDYSYIDSLDYAGRLRVVGNSIDIGANESNFAYESTRVGFTTDILSGTAPLTVKFTDTTQTDNIISIKWDFENDGTWDVLDSAEITHTYNRPGVYSVSMLALKADSTPVFVLSDSLIEVTGDITATDKNITNIPQKFYLNQNYPNPFNPTTTISYGLPQTGIVKISVFNILGERVKVLSNEIKTPGNYQVVWNGKNEQGNSVTSGIYFYQLQSDNFVSTKKMFFIK